MSETAGPMSAYVDALKREHASGVAREHAYRPALKVLIEAVSSEVHAVNDPARQACGAPDFVVSNVRRGQRIDVGYVEAKDLDVDLDDAERSEQVQRYLRSLDNFVLTNYLEFRFYRQGVSVAVSTIGKLNRQITHDATEFDSLRHLLSEFVSYRGQSIRSARTLAELMARKAQLMRDVFFRTLKDTSHRSGLHEQLEAFRHILIHDMDEAQFADVYAQTITYGLFTARLHDPTLGDFSRQEARDLIPRSNPFLRKLFDYVCGADLDDRVVWIVDALCEVYSHANIHDILTEFGASTGRTDPVVHFYETFLAEYDARLRKVRGVWYTPEPVVAFIVRAIDDVLVKDFGLKAGLADSSKIPIQIDDQLIDNRTRSGKAKKTIEVHRVQLLDVATGTGTFTANAIRRIHSRFRGQEGMWSSYVEEHLLPRLHGFEILMASYAMCHLKIDLLLQQLGYEPSRPQAPPRLSVYLTNSLEEHHPDADTLFASFLAKEANEASRIKRDMPIMVAYGNPPYSGISSNRGEWISAKIEEYKYVDGVHFGERKHWLNDDYVKFIRLAEDYIERNGQGVLGYITNHGYLDNPTFRGMRWHLLKTFDEIRVIDLHGSTLRNEVTPEGNPDENVFDILPGVSIIIATKRKGKTKALATVHHAELWGRRDAKYEWLSENSLESTEWTTLLPAAPYYFFVPKATAEDAAYSLGFPIKSLMPTNVTGVQTGKDAVLVAETAQKLKDNVRREFGATVGDDVVRRISYRPFDTRHMYYVESASGNPYPSVRLPASYRSRSKVMKHMAGDANICLLIPRQLASEGYAHAFVSNLIPEMCVVSNVTKEQNVAFPLYLRAEPGFDLGEKRAPNFNQAVAEAFCSALELPFSENESNAPQSSVRALDLFDYIYAVLNSPAYRETYREQLKIDFPRIPQPEDAASFWALVKLGAELRQLHLLKHPSLSEFITTFPQRGNGRIEYLKRDGDRVQINDGQFFGGVPDVAWNFRLGAYRPAQKWLKDRVGQTLTSDEIRHWQIIVSALASTHAVQLKIDTEMPKADR